MSHVVVSARRGSQMTKFSYNYKWALGWLRKRLGWMGILRHGDTRSITTFTALKSFYDHKLDLRATVTGCKVAKEIILNSKF